jgi:hypothetical protein
VKLDPADIPKAMWAESSPDGKLVWTSSGNDLIAYSAADINPANAAPAGPLIKPVARLARAVPPSGITGAAFYNGRLFLAGSSARRFQVWSVDTATGQRRLEIERKYVGEPEGLAVFTGLGGILHAQILPAIGSVPTFGAGHGALVHFAPAGTVRLRLKVSPGRARAGAVTRFKFRVTFAADGGKGPLKGVTVRFARKRTKTDSHGRASIRAVVTRAGRPKARATKPGFRTGTVRLRIR